MATLEYVTMELRPNEFKGIGLQVKIMRASRIGTYYPGIHSAKRLENLIAANEFRPFVSLPYIIVNVTFRQRKGE